MARRNLRDLGITLGMLGAATLLCFGLSWLDSGSKAYAAMLYILAVFLVARCTGGYLWGILASCASVLLVNYLFTFPYFYFNFTLAGYPVAIVSMLAVSVITSAITSQSKAQEQMRIQAEKEKTRSNLLRAVSHDLRTPLTSILGNAALLKEDGLLADGERRELAEEIEEDAGWLIKMVENLLTITRIDGDESARITKEPEAVEEVVASAAAKFRKRFQQPTLTVTIPDELMMVPMDAVLIEQVLSNLLENAAIHAEGARQAALRVFREGERAVFEVADDGKGISQAILPYLFEGYFKRRYEEKQDRKRNMGIGLSVCHTIVKAHGGEMSAYNAGTGGAVFRFELPLEESL